MEELQVGIVVGSVRPGRRGTAVARWVHEHAARRAGLAAEIVDIADYDLPVLDEPLPAAYGRYAQPHTEAWADAIAAFDAYVFVTPEYNRSIPGPLKNAIDFLYAEWHDKAAGFVSYGIDAGGARAVEHLRVVMGELRVADVRAQVALSLEADFSGEEFIPRPDRGRQLDALLDQLAAWGAALRTVRHPAAVR
ncbi:NAD(P)H-dependent FMN reductase [Pseudonocardia thermophila]|jgi:Predicted flavoprotein|uniref:NAD(P)H-dependent FMN reductase n=1 Tax=Pseudonocardia thermophila TaxID=1848 RepID=A0A1M7ACI9_PSETH|nr:NAD(P)H-dependent oxidoreductase [Pseudonocardia thermophila]SHL40376.1 NAD(P)H-dependent FMN reductase [Pseudonocardia thermophila]